MPKSQNSSTSENPTVPTFLKELLSARSPSGYEDEARKVVEKRVSSIADHFFTDALGSCHAILENKKGPSLMLRVISTNLD